MGKLRAFLNETFKSRYTCYLEMELERSRSEYKQLLDAMLTSQGLPNILPHDTRALPNLKKRLMPSQFRAEAERRTRTHEEQKDVT